MSISFIDAGLNILLTFEQEISKNSQIDFLQN